MRAATIGSSGIVLAALIAITGRAVRNSAASAAEGTAASAIEAAARA
jgi:hypothetical protein